MKISIPTSLNEITLNQYLHFRKLAKDYAEHEDFLTLSLVTIFCNLSIEDAKALEVNDFAEIVETLKNTLTQKPQFTERFKLDGVEYGFIPNLDKISAGEYIDLDTYLSDEGTYYDAMAVCYRPITESFSKMYQIEKYEGADKYRQSLVNMPAGIALGAVLFFWTLSKELLSATQHFLTTNKEAATLLQASALAKNGDGMQALIQSLQAAELLLNEQLNSTSTAS
jgi:hypothetical protein